MIKLLSKTHIDVTNDHRVSIAVEEIFAFRIAAKDDGLTAGSSWQAGVDEFCIGVKERKSLAIPKLFHESLLSPITIDTPKRKFNITVSPKAMPMSCFSPHKK